MKFEVIIEKGDNEYWGRIEAKNFLPTTVADTVGEVLDNLKMLIADHIEYEGKDDAYWKNIDPQKIEFVIRYDLTEVFEKLKFLNISAVASQANINESLMRQYVSGVKFPSAKRLKVIEETIHNLGALMQKIELTS